MECYPHINPLGLARDAIRRVVTRLPYEFTMCGVACNDRVKWTDVGDRIRD
jgi:hypothetical protein